MVNLVSENSRAGTSTLLSYHVCGVAGPGTTTSHSRSIVHGPVPCGQATSDPLTASGFYGSMASSPYGLSNTAYGTPSFDFQMSMPLLIALLLAIKALGSALLLRTRPSSSIMSLVRRGLACLFEEPTDAVHLRHMIYEKFSTFIGMTNVLYAMRCAPKRACMHKHPPTM